MFYSYNLHIVTGRPDMVRQIPALDKLD